jgi:DNA-binding NtrC family response regulator
MPRILVVDDEAAISFLLAKVFARAGYEVRTAANALQAMMFLASESFDALLSDVHMQSKPPMDGHDLARWVAKNHPRVRCVLMTALGFGCEECPFAAGCKILAKPFEPEDAVAMIEHVLGEPAN